MPYIVAANLDEARRPIAAIEAATKQVEDLQEELSSLHQKAAELAEKLEAADEGVRQAQEAATSGIGLFKGSKRKQDERRSLEQIKREQSRIQSQVRRNSEEITRINRQLTSAEGRLAQAQAVPVNWKQIRKFTALSDTAEVRRELEDRAREQSETAAPAPGGKIPTPASLTDDFFGFSIHEAIAAESNTGVQHPKAPSTPPPGPLQEPDGPGL